MTAMILRADARNLPLPDASVDLVVTSPPYFALRSYTDGGEHYAGQIGAEPTPAEYVASLIDCTREWVRVLKPSGSLFVNLGDKYSGGQGVQGATGGRADRSQAATYERRGSVAGFRPKSLMMLPERYRIAAVDELGLIARAVIVWSKPNGLPESVTDRVRRSHEDWVHLTKQPRYFSAVDEIREQHSDRTHPFRLNAGMDLRLSARAAGQQFDPAGTDRSHRDGNPLGKLPGSVWEIATEPLKVPAELGIDHFAAFPTEWPRRIIQGWSPSGICTACGEGRRPVAKVEHTHNRKGRQWNVLEGGPEGSVSKLGWESVKRITGEACACPDTTAPTRPSVVLDPFSGTGTTVLVASALGRHGIGVDMSADYCRLAQWRVNDPGQRAKVLRVAKPPAELPGQQTLDFGNVA